MRNLLFALLLLAPIPAAAQVAPKCDFSQMIGNGLAYGSNGNYPIPAGIGASTTTFTCTDPGTGLYVSIADFESLNASIFGETDYTVGWKFVPIPSLKGLTASFKAAEYFVNVPAGFRRLYDARGSVTYTWSLGIIDVAGTVGGDFTSNRTTGVDLPGGFAKTMFTVHITPDLSASGSVQGWHLWEKPAGWNPNVLDFTVGFAYDLNKYLTAQVVYENVTGGSPVLGHSTKDSLTAGFVYHLN